MIRKSNKDDLPMLMPIFDEARGTIAKLGINQWQDGYPHEKVITDDIKNERSYLVEIDDTVCGTFALFDNGEPTYDRIYNGSWLTGNSKDGYTAIHRVAISVSKRGTGISTAIIAYAEEHAKKLGKKSIRIDTHEGNIVMRKMLEKHGLTYCGVIYLENGDPRVAYEKKI